MCWRAGQQLAKVNMPTALGMLVCHLKFELTPEARTALLLLRNRLRLCQIWPGSPGSCCYS